MAALSSFKGLGMRAVLFSFPELLIVRSNSSKLVGTIRDWLQLDRSGGHC